jgi:hypothetical protein
LALDIALPQGDNQFLAKLTNVSEDWSFGLTATDLGGSAMPDVAHSARARSESSVSKPRFK